MSINCEEYSNGTKNINIVGFDRKQFKINDKVKNLLNKYTTPKPIYESQP